MIAEASENIETSGQAAPEQPFIVEGSAAGARLDKFLGDKLEHLGLSRERVKVAIKSGQVEVDGQACTQPSRHLLVGQRVTARVELPPAQPQPEEGGLSIVYKDAAVLVLDKPAGLTVHPAPSCPGGTLVNRLLSHVPELAALPGMRPGIVHRIDKDTSGLLLVALTESARLKLSADFADRRVKKEYLALVHGVPVAPRRHPLSKGAGPEWSLIDAPIARHPTQKTRMAVQEGGRPAQSSWRVLHADPEGRFALVAVRIHTGRTHQIRVHMAHIGHPLVGDTVYGPKKVEQFSAKGAISRPISSPISRQMLHAWKLTFTHPESGEECAFVCPPPPDFLEAVDILSCRAHRIILTGSPGCGKSLALRYMAENGLPVASADEIVRELYEPGNGGWHLLRAQYGERFVKNAHSPVDKAALSAALAREPGLRRELETLIHPLVSERLDAFFRQADQTCQMDLTPTLACAEIPLFLEGGWQGERPPGGLTLAGVHCPLSMRRERLHARGWSDEVIDRMESWQWPEDRKMRAADVVLDNTGTPENLRKHVNTLVERLRTAAAQARRDFLESVASLWKS